MNVSLWHCLAPSVLAESGATFVDPIVVGKEFDADTYDVMNTLDALWYLQEYLDARNIRAGWRSWLGLEAAFRQIVISRRDLPSAGDKLLFGEMAFVLLDDEFPRPLSRHIAELRNAYPVVRGILGRLLLRECDSDGSNDLPLLGRQQSDRQPFLLASKLRFDVSARQFAADLLRPVCALSTDLQARATTP